MTTNEIYGLILTMKTEGIVSVSVFFKQCKILWIGLLWFILGLCPTNSYSTQKSIPQSDNSTLYRWVKNPKAEAERVNRSSIELRKAIANPEYMLDHWLELPVSPESKNKKPLTLSLREAILLALRYNSNIQNNELDRIIQRYQLRIAYNEFELQYALSGAASIQNARYSNIGETQTHSYQAAPEIHLKTKWGTTLTVDMENNVDTFDTYTPVLNATLTQPLLHGFDRAVNEASLKNAIDNEFLNKVNLKQSISNQITEVITAYRTLILSGNNLQNQKLQLEEARKTFEINKKKIAAGQLERTGNVQQSYQIESLNLMVEQAENDFTIAAQNLLQVIGLAPDMHLLVPNDITVKKIVIPDLNESINIALENNVQYLAEKMKLRADERAYQVAKNDQLWQLDFTANAVSGRVTDVDGNNGLRGIYNGRNTSESANLTLTIPINDLNRKNTLIQAKVNLEKDRLNLIALKRKLMTTITNTINNIKSLAKRYRLAEKQVKLAEQSYRLEKKKQQAGIASALDVSNTQNQLIQAQAGLISAKIAYLNQLSDLQRMLGLTLEHWHIKLRYGE